MLISSSMSRHLSTRNISSKSIHAFLVILLTDRQTDKQTDRQTPAIAFTSSQLSAVNFYVARLGPVHTAWRQNRTRHGRLSTKSTELNMFYFGDNADREAVEFDFVASVYRPLQGPVRQPQSTSLFFRTH